MALKSFWEADFDGLYLLLERRSCQILEDAYQKDPRSQFALKYRKMIVNFDDMTYLDTDTQKLKKIRRSEKLSPGSWQYFRDGGWKEWKETSEPDIPFQYRSSDKTGWDFDAMKSKDSFPLRRISKDSPPPLETKIKQEKPSKTNSLRQLGDDASQTNEEGRVVANFQLQKYCNYLFSTQPSMLGRSREGDPPLAFAIKGNHIGLARKLLKGGADIMEKDRDGTPLLCLALEYPLWNGTLMFQLLILESPMVDIAHLEGLFPRIRTFLRVNQGKLGTELVRSWLSSLCSPRHGQVRENFRLELGIIGQQQAKDILMKMNSVSDKRRTFFFCGADDIGKRALARQLAINNGLPFLAEGGQASQDSQKSLYFIKIQNFDDSRSWLQSNQEALKVGGIVVFWATLPLNDGEVVSGVPDSVVFVPFYAKSFQERQLANEQQLLVLEKAHFPMTIEVDPNSLQFLGHLEDLESLVSDFKKFTMMNPVASFVLRFQGSTWKWEGKTKYLAQPPPYV